MPTLRMRSRQTQALGPARSGAPKVLLEMPEPLLGEATASALAARRRAWWGTLDAVERHMMRTIVFRH